MVSPHANQPRLAGARRARAALERIVVLRLGTLSTRLHVRSAIVATVGLLGITVTFVLALTLGAGGLELGSLFFALHPEASHTQRLIFEWRAARAIAAIALGACLAISGALFQAVTRNPLGSPDLIGIGSGAYAGVIMVIILGGAGFLAFAGGAIVGALVTAAVISFLAYRRGIHGFRLIITGIAVGAILRALTSWFSIKADLDTALQAAIWDAGSLYGITWEHLGWTLAVLAVVMTAVPFAARALPTYALGDDLAAVTGLRVERTKILLVALGVILTALATAAAGPISFIALAAPQIARRISRDPRGLNLGLSALTGALLLASADLVAQHAVATTTLPVGAVTVVIGGAYLVWLLTREGRRS